VDEVPCRVRFFEKDRLNARWGLQRFLEDYPLPEEELAKSLAAIKDLPKPPAD